MFYKEIKKKSQTAFHEILSVVELKLKKKNRLICFFFSKYQDFIQRELNELHRIQEAEKQILLDLKEKSML